jgi:hypothetical protein
MRNTEVSEFDGFSVSEPNDIGGLDVAVKDAFAVRVVQCVGNLQTDHQRITQEQAFTIRHELVQRAAVQKFHRYVRAVIYLAYVEDGHNVWM